MKDSFNKKNEVCCLFTYPSHYRANIYTKMEKELNCDFFFGDIKGSKIKKINYSVFEKKVTDCKTAIFFGFSWLIGAWTLSFKNYKRYILTGDFRCLTVWVILVLNKVQNKKTYLWTHGWYGRESVLKRIVKKMFFYLSDGVLLYGNYAKNLMIKEGICPDKLHVIYNSLDYENHLKLKKTLQISNLYKDHFKNDFPVLFYIGRIQTVKKIEQVLDAMLALKEKKVFVNFAIVGGLEEGFDFENEVVKRGLEASVWLIGPCYDEKKIGNYIYNADVCVSPGNIGLTAIHCLTFDTPVITHDNFKNQMPEFEVIEDNEKGLFFRENDVEDLSYKIRLILKNNNKNKDISEVIDNKWNPKIQIELLKSILK